MKLIKTALLAALAVAPLATGTAYASCDGVAFIVRMSVENRDQGKTESWVIRHNLESATPDTGPEFAQEVAEANKLVPTIYTELRHRDEDDIVEWAKVRCQFPNYQPARKIGPK
jgi:hypothetical protein